MGANSHPLILLRYFATNMQLTNLRIEINRCDADEESDMDPFRGCAASNPFGRYFSNGRCAEEVCGRNKVVGMPLSRDQYFGICRGDSKAPTMSSGSSGKSVMVPEPSRSIFCFMRRILFPTLCRL